VAKFETRAPRRSFWASDPCLFVPFPIVCLAGAFDKIKLDQSFVKRLPGDAAAAAIVRTVLALGKSLGMPVLAEGVETKAQWQFLAREGCDKGQGYLFADRCRLPNRQTRFGPLRMSLATMSLAWNLTDG
jgi:EAL domain-containing protein (putative c-di-GMP-specific phosphodiesterase class I)